MTDQAYTHSHESSLGLILRIERSGIGMNLETTHKKIRVQVLVPDQHDPEQPECTLRIEEHIMEVQRNNPMIGWSSPASNDGALPLRWRQTSALELEHLQIGDLDALINLFQNIKDTLQEEKSS